MKSMAAKTIVYVSYLVGLALATYLNLHLIYAFETILN